MEVVDLRSLVPFDADTVLASAARTRRVVVAHHATRFAGFGAEVAAMVGEELFGTLEAPVRRVGAPLRPHRLGRHPGGRGHALGLLAGGRRPVGHRHVTTAHPAAPPARFPRAGSEVRG